MIKKTRCKMQDTRCRSLSCIMNHTSCIRSSRASCIMNHAGFTLTELLVTMVIFVLAIAAASQIFTGLLTQFKQQSKIAETNIEGAIGLEILRQDLEHAGYGLPWNPLVLPVYLEASSSTPCGTADPSSYNDAPSDPPSAVLSGNNNCTNSSDYLVIKAVHVVRNDPSRKSTRLISTAPYVRTWVPPGENLNPNDWVIVIKGGAGASSRELVGSTQYSNVTNTPWRPTENTDNRIVYGIDPDTNPRMPFNRADYYISTANVPQRCAASTGVFVKATKNQDDGGFNILPLLDCVADMQVVYRRDTDADGTIDNHNTADISALTAQQIREQVKEIRVYFLAHEGQRDPNYTYPNNPLLFVDGIVGTVINFNFTTQGITNWQNYRWKIYTIVVKPENLRGE